MTIRRATGADAETVARLHVESWKVAYRGIMPDDVIARTDLAYRTGFWKERIGDQGWPIFLLEADESETLPEISVGASRNLSATSLVETALRCE